jgi:hypothetical protein
MGLFDPAALANMQFDQDNSTQFVPVPVGEYVATSSDMEITTWQSREGDKSGMKINLKWNIDDAAVKELLEREQVAVKQDIMLDMTEQGGLDFGKGKNVRLGQLREALGLNVKGEPFSFQMLNGRMALVSVTHRLVDGVPFAEIKSVAKIA